MKKYVLAIDQGTTGSTALLFDKAGNLHAKVNKEFRQIYPKPGWVEHDPEEILQVTLDVVKEALSRAGAESHDVAAIGITNQRETTVVFDRETGKPFYNAIVWQCRRTAPLCEKLKKQGLSSVFQKKTGLVIDAYFSGTKLKWILDNVPGVKNKAKEGKALFGTIDTFLIYHLTGCKTHVTDYSNASRTLIFNIHKLTWDKDLLKILSIPAAMLPQVLPTSHIYGETVSIGPLEQGIPVASCVGDQQGALFGQACFKPGVVKNTYGTGCFALMNTGEKAVPSKHKLLTTIAWGLDGKVEYALEGSIFIAGAAVQWLRDEMKLIENAGQSESYAAQVSDTGGVYFVPAFVGLGAPYWDMYARGTMVGATRGTNRFHLVRAVLESIAYQTRDVLDAMKKDSGLALKELRVDGGAVANNFLMQFQSDVLGVPVKRPKISETTAAGAAFLAGLATGFWNSKKEIEAIWQEDRAFSPCMKPSQVNALYKGWQKAVERAKGWAT